VIVGTVGTLFAWGLVAHLVADWLLQNEWMAVNKAKVGHPAGFVHAAVHAVALGLVFGPIVGVVLGVVHYVVDLRTLLAEWGQLLRQTREGPMAVHVAIWRDQVVHVVCVLIAAQLGGS
jgi:hypothetical protein